MLDQQRYVDAAALDEYNANDGQELVVSVLVDAGVGEAFDALLKHSWVGSNRELAPGVGRGLVGHSRQLPTGSIETIQSAGLPQGGDAIASICYKLQVDKSWIAQDHIGLISFVPDTTTRSAADKTLVMWAIKIVPTSFGSVFLCGGSLLRVVLRAALTSALDALKRKLSKYTHHQ